MILKDRNERVPITVEYDELEYRMLEYISSIESESTGMCFI